MEAYAQHLLKRGKKDIKLLIVGRVGYGKSALVNTLFGENVVEEGDSAHSVTNSVSSHDFDIHGIKVTVADTPGFFGLKTKTAKDIVEEIREHMEEVDLLLFCIKMTERFTTSEEDLMKIVVKEYRREVLLNHTIFALTFANKVTVPRHSKARLPEHFTRKLDEMKEVIHSAIGNYAQLTVKEAAQIPIIPVGYDDRRLPNMEDWFVPFWFTCFKRTNELTKAAFLVIGIEQMMSGSINASCTLNRDDVATLEQFILSEGQETDQSTSFLLRVLSSVKKLLGLQ